MGRRRSGRRGCCAALAALALTRAAAGQAPVTPPRPAEAPSATWPGEPSPHDVVVPVVVTVGEDGAVESAEVTASVSEELDAAALRAVLTWRFEPALRDGRPVRAKVSAVVRFVGVPRPAPSGVAPEGAATGGPAQPAEAGEAGGAAAEPSPPAAAAPEAPAAGDAPAPAAAGARAIDVTGARRSAPPAAAGDFRVRPGALRAVPRHSAEQMLTLAPGLSLANHGGELHPSAIFLRGFDAGEGQDLEMTLEGVPLNETANPHGHGYADAHFLIPELVREVRVVEGPFEPRQGDFAVAGSVEYSVGLEQRGVHALAGVGSYGARRFALLWGPAREADGTFAGVDLLEGDGFGPARAYASARAVAGWERRLDETTTLHVLATSYSGRAGSAGVLREDDLEARRIAGCGAEADAQFFCTYDANQGLDASRHGLSVRATHTEERWAWSSQAFGALRALRVRENYTGWLADVPPPGSPQRGDGLEQLYDAATVGLRGTSTHWAEWRGHRQEIEVGYFVRHDAGTTRQWRLRSPGGEPYSTDFDNRFRVTDTAAHVAGRLAPWRWLVLRGGVRADAFSFGVIDRNRPTSSFGESRLGQRAVAALGFAVQPRASVEYRPVEWLSWVTAYGVGTRSSDAQALSDGELAPFARVQAAETGVRFHEAAPREPAWDARVIAFGTHVDRDLVFDELAGRNVIEGASKRYGALASGLIESRIGLTASGSVTYAEAYVAEAGAGPLELGTGVRLPYIPRWVGRLDTALTRALHLGDERLGWGLAAGASYVAPPPLPLEQLGEPRLTVDASGRVRWELVEAALEVTNLLDRRNREAEFNYASNFRGPDRAPSLLPRRHFVAGAPRQILATLTLHFDDGAAPHEPDARH
ncbi:MAG: TonB-dependent receptor [Polyangiaceae bacterium]|nr:TonB-dependent receptor [Polyangiaceae bacterium]